jgi:GTPase SAR1 family protein
VPISTENTSQPVLRQARVNGMVVLQLVLDLRMDDIAGNEDAFKADVRQDLAEALNETLNRIHVLNISAGSVIVIIGIVDGGYAHFGEQRLDVRGADSFTCYVWRGYQHGGFERGLSAFQSAQKLILQASEEESPLKDKKHRRYTSSIKSESIRILSRGLFSSRLQRLAEVMSHCDDSRAPIGHTTWSVEKVMSLELLTQVSECPHGLPSIKSQEPAPARSELDVAQSAANTRSLRREWQQRTLLSFLTGRDCVRLAADSSQNKREKRALKAVLEPCSQHCALNDAGRSIITMRSGGGQIVVCLRKGEKKRSLTGMDTADDKNFNEIDLSSIPVWTYFVRRWRWTSFVRRWRAIEQRAPEMTASNLPLRAAHTLHQCGICSENIAFCLMRVCYPEGHAMELVLKRGVVEVAGVPEGSVKIRKARTRRQLDRGVIFHIEVATKDATSAESVAGKLTEDSINSHLWDLGLSMRTEILKSRAPIDNVNTSAIMITAAVKTRDRSFVCRKQHCKAKAIKGLHDRIFRQDCGKSVRLPDSEPIEHAKRERVSALDHQKERAITKSLPAGPASKWQVEEHVSVDLKPDGSLCSRLRRRIQESREVSIFLSSPFQGLHEERAGLLEQHGPDLIAMCERRGVTLTFIDLRWGITSAASKNHLTVKTCLEAARDSDIFVGCYGQRYGTSMLDGKSQDWLVPSLECCYENFPWLQNLAPLSEDGRTTKKSVTHLEFECGYHGQHEQDEGGNPAGPVVGFAFFRDKMYDECKSALNDTDAWMYRAENDESAQLLEQLKVDTKGWAGQGRGAFFTYGVPQQFYRTVADKLKELLNAAIPGPEHLDSVEFAQESHLRRLTFGYAGVEKLESKLQAYIRGSVSKPLVVTSAPGGGKSALLANTIQLFRNECSKGGAFCIYHFVGVNASSQNLDHLLDHLKQQVLNELGYKGSRRDLEKKYELTPLDKKLAWVITQWGEERKLLIVIDGLNELSNGPSGDGCQHLPHDLLWLMHRDNNLPQPWPSNVKLVISTLGECEQYKSGKCLHVVDKFKTEFFDPILVIPKVDQKQCEDMITSLLRSSRKEIDNSFRLQDELTAYPERANPLFITIFVNELKYFSGYRLSHSAFEQVGDFLKYLLQATDVGALLGLVFTRLERIHCLPVPENPEFGRHNLLGRLKTPDQTKNHELPAAHLHSSQPAEDVERHVILQGASRTVDPGTLLLLPNDPRVWRVIQVCSPSEFKIMDHGPSLSRNQEDMIDDECVYVITESLVAKVVQFIWLSSGGLKLSEILDLLKEAPKVFCKSKEFPVTQEQLLPLLASLHRLMSRNGGLWNVHHEVVRRAVESRYFAFSQPSIRSLDIRQRISAEDKRRDIHKWMAQYFRERSRTDDMSDLQVLPRAIREKNHHETQSGEQPSFRVVARVRPLIGREIKEGLDSVFVRVDRLQMCAEHPRTKQPRIFTMDCCVSGMEDQEIMWRRIGGHDLVEKALNGINLTVMAYGQTGSGKTYTMFGKPCDATSQITSLKQSVGFDSTDEGVTEGSGLIPRIVTGLFEGLKRIAGDEKGFESSIRLSVVEIHNERVRDLRTVERQQAVDLRILGSLVQNLSSREIHSTSEAMSEMQTAYSNRVTNVTAMNDQSSRSHCIIILAVKQTYKHGAGNFEVNSLINLVDLAGSERGRTRKITEKKYIDARKLHHEGDGGRKDEFEALEGEATSINKSLLVLNQVISRLAHAKKGNEIVAPFRESKLTQLLRPSLHGNTFSVMVVNVSPSPKDYGETLNALEYAGAAKNIRNKVTQNAKDVMLQEIVEDVFRLDNEGLQGSLQERVQRHATKMRALKVTNEGIDSLPECLQLLLGLMQGGGPPKLETAFFEGCDGLQELPAEITRLTRLRTLNLRKCAMLTSLPVGLGALTRLQKLDMSGCSGLTALPAELEALTRLQELDLSECSGLTALPAGLVALTGLRELDLSGCSGLMALPAGLGALTGLRELDLSSCSALHMPPRRVVAAGTDAVLAFLRDMASGSAPCHLVKLMLLGEQRAGKSSLADSLVLGCPETRPADDRTVGIDVRRWWLGAGKGAKGGEVEPVEELVANIYDVAGHRVYRASHGAFMSADALFLHVVRSDAPEASAAAAVLEWVEAVQQEAPGAVMGVVWTHVDLLEDPGKCNRLQRAVLARVQAEIERQMRAVDEAMRQAEREFDTDAAWREKQAQRDAEQEALDRGLAAWQETGAQSADSKSIGQTMDALARLAMLHREMQEIEARMVPKGIEQQHARDKAKQRLQRLREQRVKRPRILFSYGVSSKTGHGLEKLREALAALMKDQRLFPHVGMRVPLSYVMLERLAQEGRLQSEPGPGSGAAPQRAAWEHAVTTHVDATASARLRALCAQPYASLRGLEREAAEVGIDKEQLHRALQFLHATGSVLHYGSGTRQHSQKLQEVVFMQPQFIIDVIKYVIRESRGEDVNDELRAMDVQIRGTPLRSDLEGLLDRGEATRSLLTELWGKHSSRDRELMLELMKGFKLLRELGGSGGGMCERYIVPAMLPNRNLPDEYVMPQWWCPEKATASAAIKRVEREAGNSGQAAMRVMYEVVGGRLPFAFMSELQVALVPKSKQNETFSPEASVIDRVAGSVLSACYKCGGGKIREWVVVSQCAQACHLICEGGVKDMTDPDAIRVMAWAELLNASQEGATDWRLLKRVMREIEEAGRAMPALYLRKLVLHVDGQDRCAEAQEVDDSFLVKEFVTFTFNDGSEDPVEVSSVLPQDGAETPLAARAVAGEQKMSGVLRRRKFVFFFCGIGTNIDTERESQELRDFLKGGYGDNIHYEPYTRPETKHFTDELESMQTRDEDVSLHFSGHGDENSGGLYWHGEPGARKKDMPIKGKQLVDLIKRKKVVEKINSFFLNACCTLAAGLELHAVGVRVVVCWQTPVRGQTSRKFAFRFYEKSFKTPGQYKEHFHDVCDEMSGELCEKTEGAPDGQRPCLLLASSGQEEQSGVKMWWWNGEEVEAIPEELLHSPDLLQPVMPPAQQHGGAGHASAPFESYEARQTAAGEEDEEDDDEEDVYKNWRPPNKDTDFAARAGQAEKEVLQRLEFNLLLDGREIGDFMHGLDGRCFLTKSALSALGIDDYSDLWGESGKVVEKASKLLLSKAHSTAARDQVRKALCELEQAVYFRQLNVMAHRFNKFGRSDGKKDLQTHKETLLVNSKENEILEKYCGDRLDRERIRQGKAAEISCEQPAETVAVHVAIEPAAKPMDVKYCTLLNKKGVKALEEASGATIKIEMPPSTKRKKAKSMGKIVIEGPTEKHQDVAWMLITRQKELDSDCEKMGLKWIKVGTNPPPEGRERVNDGLATALATALGVETTSELKEEEFGNLGICDLRGDDFIKSGDSYFKPAVCGKCKHCIRATHFLQLDKVFEAKEKLHALLLCQKCIRKDTAEGPGKFARYKFYCEKCWKAPVEELEAVPQEANEACSLAMEIDELKLKP